MHLPKQERSADDDHDEGGWTTRNTTLTPAVAYICCLLEATCMVGIDWGRGSLTAHSPTAKKTSSSELCESRNWLMRPSVAASGL